MLASYPFLSKFHDIPTKKLGDRERFKFPTCTVDVIYSFSVGDGQLFRPTVVEAGMGWPPAQVADALEIFPRAGELSRLFGFLAVRPVA